LPLSSQIVAVTFAVEADKFAKATPITKPAVLSYGTVIVVGNCVWSGTVPSETGLFDDAVRKIANPFTGPELLTSAHPTTVDANWPVVMSEVAFGFMVAVTDEVVVVSVAPWFVVVTGKLNALPSSL
jgi:hypothetical protein